MFLRYFFEMLILFSLDFPSILSYQDCCLHFVIISLDYPENVFKCAISVAPPTDWLFYDTIYTERHMGLPEDFDNLEGYTRSSLLNKFEQLRGKNFMINHGVAGKDTFMFFLKCYLLYSLYFQMTMSTISIP